MPKRQLSAYTSESSTFSETEDSYFSSDLELPKESMAGSNSISNFQNQVDSQFIQVDAPENKPRSPQEIEQILKDAVELASPGKSLKSLVRELSTKCVERGDRPLKYANFMGLLRTHKKIGDIIRNKSHSLKRHSSYSNEEFVSIVKAAIQLAPTVESIRQLVISLQGDYPDLTRDTFIRRLAKYPESQTFIYNSLQPSNNAKSKNKIYKSLQSSNNAKSKNKKTKVAENLEKETVLPLSQMPSAALISNSTINPFGLFSDAVSSVQNTFQNEQPTSIQSISTEIPQTSLDKFSDPTLEYLSSLLFAKNSSMTNTQKSDPINIYEKTFNDSEIIKHCQWVQNIYESEDFNDLGSVQKAIEKTKLFLVNTRITLDQREALLKCEEILNQMEEELTAERIEENNELKIFRSS